MVYNIGVNVIETEGRASPAVAGAPTSVAGFVVRTRRGPTNQVIRVSNFRQFVDRFGGHDSSYASAYCLDGFFLNGGREAYIARVVGENKSASVVLQDIADPAGSLKASAGYRGVADSGAWGDDLSVEIQPTFSTRLAESPVSSLPTPQVSFSKVQVESFAGLRKGDRVYLTNGTNTDWRKIEQLETEVDQQSGQTKYFLSWNKESPITNPYEKQAILSTGEFKLIVRLKPTTGSEPQVVETWEKLVLDPNSPNYAPLRTNDPYTGSTYISLQDSIKRDNFPSGQRDILETKTFNLSGGADGSIPSEAAYQEALNRFDTIDIQLLACPALEAEMSATTLEAVTTAGLSYCANRGDCLFVGQTSAKRDLTAAKTFGQEFQAAKVYGALYWPWITVTNPVGLGSAPTIAIPPTGHVLGVYARIDQTRGVWKAPAGNEAVLRGALSVEQDVTDVDHTDLVKNGSVNGIRSIRGTGTVIDASRTLSTDTRWLYVSTRLLFNYVKVSLRDGLRWVKQEPNRDTLWNKIKYTTVNPFLMRLYQSGAFGAGTPEQVFTVICGPENNPPQEVDLGNLRIEVYFYPAKPAETILIVVGQQDSGATVNEQ